MWLVIDNFDSLNMDISLILKTIGIGILVAVAAQILQRTGREEQATLVTLAGVIVVLIMLVSEIGELFLTIKNIFDL